MELTINVDSEMFNDVMEKGLKALTAEKLEEVIIGGINEALKDNNYKLIEKLLIQDGCAPWHHPEFTDLAKTLIKQADYSKLQTVVDACIDEMVKNYKHLLIEVLTDALVTGLTSTYALQNAIKDSIKSEAYKTLD